jgi:hypothetical protein
MEFEDKNWSILILFYNKVVKTNVTFPSYVKSLDIGIEFIGWLGSRDYYTYKIIDEKKWTLSKIKYGI